MRNKLEFENFLTMLKSNNRNLSFFVDWKKCLENRDKISICLNHLNLLLGKNKDEIKSCINMLFDEYPKAFSVLNLLIAVRNKNDLLFNQNGKEVALNSYFNDPQKIYEFISQSGLEQIFLDKKIKDLNDFVFGVEVGLDTNARKNRSGKAMEEIIATLFKNANLDYKEQVNINNFSDLKATFGEDIKKFDFVIFGFKKTYFIECNFYSGGGSKLNETARSYQELVLKFKNFSNYEFIWITDGQGWLSARNKLEEAYKSVTIYNLSNIQDFIQRVQNDKS